MISSHFDDSLGIMIHIGSEVITLAEILDAIGRWLKHPSSKSQRPMVWDIRGAFMNVSFDELRPVVSFMNDLVRQNRVGKIAWVFRMETTRSMISMVGDEITNKQWGMFQSYEEAIEWCRL